MNANKKSLLSLFLITALSLSFMGTDCRVNQAQNDDKPVKVSKFTKIEQSVKFVNEDNAYNLTLSFNKNWIYFTTDSTTHTRANLYGVEIGGEANFAKNVFDESKWGKIPLATGLGGGVAKAALASASGAVYLSAATDGVLVSLNAAIATDRGVSYIKGRNHIFAWKSHNDDLDNIVNPGEFPVGFMVKKKNAANVLVDVPYVFNYHRFTGITHGTLEAAKMTFAVNRDGAPFATMPAITYDDVSNEVFAVDNTGVAIMKNNDIGTAHNFSPVVTASAGADRWKQQNGINNRRPQTLFVANGKLYIGLSASGANTGGVAVYDIATPLTKGPAASSWSNVSVIGFVEFDGKVLAVSKDGLYEVDDTEAEVLKGELAITPATVTHADNQAVKDYNALKDGYEGAMPTEITNVEAVGDHLFLTVLDDGVYVMVNQTQMVSKPK